MADNPSLQCATTVMDTFHMIMDAIHTEMQQRASAILSMRQFRAMMSIKHHEGLSLSQVSEHLGGTLSATSKLVDGLAERGYIHRKTSAEDRRRLILALTDAGEQALNSVHLEGLSCLAERLDSLSPSEYAIVDLAMNLLRSALRGNNE